MNNDAERKGLVGMGGNERGLQSELRVQTILEKVPGVIQVMRSENMSTADVMGIDLTATLSQELYPHIGEVHIQVKSRGSSVTEFRSRLKKLHRLTDMQLYNWLLMQKFILINGREEKGWIFNQVVQKLGEMEQLHASLS